MGNNNQNILQSNNNDEINKLKNELTKANKVIEQQKLTINELQNKLNNYNNTINNLNNDINNYRNIISKKDIELNNYKSQLNNTNIQNTKYNFNDIMCVNFISSDQNVHYAATCLKTNTFAEVEEKLYKQYPQYRETNNTFLANGMQVLRFKTIDENKIGNGLPVTLIVPS
jgi:chromosome segregation ATPase